MFPSNRDGGKSHNAFQITQPSKISTINKLDHYNSHQNGRFNSTFEIPLSEITGVAIALGTINVC